MARLGSGPLVSIALGAGFLATISLVLPWFTIAGRSRSSIDLVSSASALEVIEGPVKVAAVACWLCAPLLVASAMLVAASGRHRAGALLLSPVTGILLLVVVIGAVVDDIRLAWGATFGLVFATVASTCAIMVLVTSRRRSE